MCKRGKLKQFHKYMNEIIEATEVMPSNKKKIVPPTQLISFLNITKLLSDPKNEEIYVCRSLNMDDILSIVWKHSMCNITIFNQYSELIITSAILLLVVIVTDMNAQGFSSRWYGARKLDLMKATVERKNDEFNRKISTRILYVAKDQYLVRY